MGSPKPTTARMPLIGPRQARSAWTGRRVARVIAVAVAGALSIGVALTLSWWLLGSDSDAAGYGQLLAVLALGVLPFATAGAWLLDRAAHARSTQQPEHSFQGSDAKLAGDKRTVTHVAAPTPDRSPDRGTERAPGRGHESRRDRRGRESRPFSSV